MGDNRITELNISGYKSLGKTQSLTIRPITLLAGANSSGKSSMLQPLLLLKQTLEASHDPGPLKIDGPNVVFSNTSQMFSHAANHEAANELKVGIGYMGDGVQRSLALEFEQTEDRTISLAREKVGKYRYEQGIAKYGEKVEITEGPIDVDTARKAARDFGYREFQSDGYPAWLNDVSARGVRTRCFLNIEVERVFEGLGTHFHIPTGSQVDSLISGLIHVPSFRGPVNSRTLPRVPIAKNFPGLMHSYLASLIHFWGLESQQLAGLEQDLETLGLATKVKVQPVDDTSLEVMVGRHIPGSQKNRQQSVNVSDVGSGLSHVMAVLVALWAANSDQLVIIELPELHLHPRAVHLLAKVLLSAEERGVQMVVETHSELLLLGIQTLVASGELDPNRVSLNWFSLDDDGDTIINQADVNPDGSFGDWPVDFLEVEMFAQASYLEGAWK